MNQIVAPEGSISGLWTSLNCIDNSALPETASYGYIPGLNGIRAVAVLFVIIAHLGLQHIVPGGFGVTIFFFISGFLITRLLLAEQGLSGRVGLGKFYLRRFARLYPALIFMVVVTAAYYQALGYAVPSKMEYAAALGYFTNFYYVALAGATETQSMMPWKPLWSLAVEEHFYLIFPVLVMACGHKIGRLKDALIFLIVGGLVWRYVVFAMLNVSIEDYNGMMTDTRFDSIVWGCLLSVLLHEAKVVQRFRAFIGAIPIALALVLLLISFVYRDEGFRYVSRYTLQGASIFILILNLYYLHCMRFVIFILEWKPLNWIGTVSYGLYLWHYPVSDMVDRAMGISAMGIGVKIALTLAITVFSFHFVEKPFNALRKRLGSHMSGSPLAKP